MKDAIELNQLSQKLDIHLENAKRNEAKGQFGLAKRNYLLSAEVLMQMAKLSSPKLAEAKMERARKLIKYAESLGADRKPQNRNVSGGSGDDEGGNEFASAQIPNIHFSDIAGLEDVKEAIRVRMIYPLKHKDLYSAYNKKMGGGVLLFGPPGTGKTMIAKAIACEVGAVFYAVKGSDIMSKYVGESEKNINSLFETARKNELSIIFIDEIDSILKKRGEDAHNDKRVNEFLQQIDGFASNSTNLLLLGATNRPWDIDSAAMRSGRFSEKIYVPLPDFDARKYMFKKNLCDVPMGMDVDFDELARRTEMYSGADISEICDYAKILPIKESIKMRENGNSEAMVKVTFDDFENAFKKVRPSVTKSELEKLDDFARNFNIDIVKMQENAKIDDFSTFSVDNFENRAAGNSSASQEQFQPKSMPANGYSGLRAELSSNVLKILPNENLRLEFFLDGSFDSVFAKIDGHNYVCKKNIKNWVIDDIKQEEGEYKVEVTADNLKTSFEIKIIKGIDEEDFGL